MNKSQKIINQNFVCLSIINLLVVVGIMMIAVLIQVDKDVQPEGESEVSVIYEPNYDATSLVSTSPKQLSVLEEETTKQYCKNLNENDKYLLAKIAMAEAEDENIETKILVISTVLNRVNSSQFPNTVEKVIFQNRNGVYQFTPIVDGRWDKVEPNEECWKAVEIVNTTESDFSEALYFEACYSEDNWHSNNLEFICQSGKTRFYK